MSTNKKNQKLIVIIGPTASGKSNLAVKIARKLGGEIVSADSRQVYKRLDIGSGKITKKEMRGVPHHLLNVASPKRIFSAARFQKLGRLAVKKILAKNKLPIICGGTGLYIDSLIYQKEFPAVAPRPKLRKKLGKLPAKKLFEKLGKLDPRRAKNIDRFNRRRLIRALEIAIITKKPVPELTAPQIADFDVLIIGIKKPKEELEKLIQKRLKKRLRQGMIAEVKNLRAKTGLSWKRLDDLGLEYRFISRCLRKLITEKEMEKLILKESMKYAKRQLTWFKKYENARWITNKKEALKLAREFIRS